MIGLLFGWLVGSNDMQQQRLWLFGWLAVVDAVVAVVDAVVAVAGWLVSLVSLVG